MSSIDTFAQQIKAKHPEYGDMDNVQLTQKILAKYPQYSDMIDAGDKTLLGNIASSSTSNDYSDLYNASKDIGNMVKGGYAGTADIVSGNGLPQAASDVNAVENGQQPTSTAGKVGDVIGSLFTPNQIIATAAAGPLVEGAMNLLGAGLAKLADILGTTPEVLSNFLRQNPKFISVAKAATADATDATSAVQDVSKAIDSESSLGQFLKDNPQASLKNMRATYAASKADLVQLAQDAPQTFIQKVQTALTHWNNGNPSTLWGPDDYAALKTSADILTKKTSIFRVLGGPGIVYLLLHVFNPIAGSLAAMAEALASSPIATATTEKFLGNAAPILGNVAIAAPTTASLINQGLSQ
jgi:hypothetical protein